MVARLALPRAELLVVTRFKAKHTVTPVLVANTFTHPQHIPTHPQHIPTHLQHTITLLLAVNMRTQLLVLFLVSNTLTQLLVILRGHNTITLCLHPHRFQDLLLTLLLSISTLLLQQRIKIDY
jgi:hypothetical protein